MRAEPELGRVQTCLGRSREAEEEKLYFPNKVVSNPCQMDPKPRNLIALCNKWLPSSLGWGREFRMAESKVFIGHKNVRCDSLEYAPGRGEINDSMGREFLKGLSVICSASEPKGWCSCFQTV